jgi:uncharacterized protein YukE
MNLRRLRIPVLLILALSIPGYAQSLGDVARKLRAERQARGTPHATMVITNDDLESTEPASEASPNASENAAPEGTRTEDAGNAQSANSTGEAAPSPKAPRSPSQEREAQELRIQQRTDEIDKRYLDRIAAIRLQINTARTELARLQRDQAESTIDFQRNVGIFPNIATYEQQQQLFNEQIEAHRDLIVSLNAQLEDAEEAARHAGVRHASD